MISISQSAALTQPATISVADAILADANVGAGVAFLQTLAQINKDENSSDLISPETLKKSDAAGGGIAEDEPKILVDDLLAQPQNWLPYTQPAFPFAVSQAALVSATLTTQRDFGSDDPKGMLDQKVPRLADSTITIADYALPAEALGFSASELALQKEAPTNVQLAATSIRPITENLFGQTLDNLAVPAAADVSFEQQSKPQVPANTAKSDKQLSVSPTTADTAMSLLQPETASAGAEIKVQASNQSERHAGVGLSSLSPDGKDDRVEKTALKEQQPSAAEMIWRHKWVDVGTNLKPVAKPTIMASDALQTTQSPAFPVMMPTNLSSDTWHRKISSDDSGLQHNDQVKSAIPATTTLPTVSYPSVAVLTDIAATVDLGSTDLAKALDRNTSDQAVFVLSDRSAFPASLLHRSDPLIAANPQSISTGLPATVAPVVVDMFKTGNGGPLELALAPEELGHLSISIKHDGDFVQVTVLADRPETLDLMRRHSAELVTELRQAGYSGASLSFGQGNHGQQSRSAASDQNRTHPQPQPQHPHADPKSSTPARAQKGSGIDMRL